VERDGNQRQRELLVGGVERAAIRGLGQALFAAGDRALDVREDGEDERLDERLLAREVAIEGAFRRTGGARDVVDRDCLDAALEEEEERSASEGVGLLPAVLVALHGRARSVGCQRLRVSRDRSVSIFRACFSVFHGFG
jgi:hypothetical protein